jgi:hypothetical protein
MLTSHSRSPRSRPTLLHTDPQRIARAAVINGVPIPADVQAQLEARGINVGDLEQRIRQNMEFTR